MRNVSDESFKENHNTFYSMFSNSLPENRAVYMRKCEKIWESWTGHKQFDTAHALCKLYN
jgi:hypothetical protein